MTTPAESDQPIEVNDLPAASQGGAKRDRAAEFQKAAQEKPPGVVAEFLDFLVHNKKWWLAPIVIILILISVFVLLTHSAVAPFIYVLF